MIHARASKLVVAVASSALLMAACGSDSDKSSGAAAATLPPAVTDAAQPAATVPATSPSVAVTTPATAGAVTTPPAATGDKVNINEASVPAMEKAFKAVGVTNANRWAREVEEYRPYPHDPDFAKLRQELGKYNIDPKILELIISTLEF